MQRPLVLNDLRATALAWSSFAAVAEADCGFSRKIIPNNSPLGLDKS